MKLPLNIAKQYTQIPEDIDSLIEIIASRIGEVESYHDISEKYKNIVVAQIKKKEDHPDADKLGVYQIDIGNEEEIQVLAGDKSLEVGDRVAYIIPGGIVPSTYHSEPFEIKAVKMRGILSNGMLCSEKELDIGPNHEKVYVLPSDAPVGESFAKYYELDDIVVEIENKALTNRGDLFGILGLAREISASQNMKFESPTWYYEKQLSLEPEDSCLNLGIDNQAESLCPRYSAVAMSNIEVKESPIWLKSTLLKSGIKPINNVVDITNYLMILTGQPMHAFDYDKVVSTDTDQADMAHIVIRTAQQGEKIHALDGNTYELSDRNLVIANSAYPIAIAGMMGGVDTQIDENTKNIILESANFDRYNLRRSSMELGIVTDSSTRYTRSQSPDLTMPILSKAVELISDIANGKISSTVKDIYPDPKDDNNISIHIEKLQTVLGIDLSKNDIDRILTNIEYEYVSDKDNYLTYKAPVFRQDLEIEEDVFEDIARIYGYENISPILPQRDISAVNQPKMYVLKKRIREVLSNRGCNEVLTYSFVSSKQLEDVRQDPNVCLRISNPLSKDLELMRPSLISSLLSKVKLNIQDGIDTFAIYELGISHLKNVIDREEELPLEEWKLALIFSDVSNNIEGNPYYQAKKYLDTLMESLNIADMNLELIADCNQDNLPDWIKVSLPTYEENTSVVITKKIGDTTIYIGILGEINNIVKDRLGLSQYTSGFELNLENILDIRDSKRKYVEISKYPSITQDICFITPDTITYSQLLHIVEQSISNDELQHDIECIDIYQTEGANDRKITLRISISNLNRTLKVNDFDKIKEKISKKISSLGISM